MDPDPIAAPEPFERQRCPMCSEFYMWKAGKKYCSQSCRMKAWRNQKAERAARFYLDLLNRELAANSYERRVCGFVWERADR